MPRILKEPKATRIARKIGMPESQVGRQDYVLHDVKNANDSDLSHMQRSGIRKTVRRTTKIDQLRKRGIIDHREALACEWYAAAYAMRYDTTGTTANYGEGGSSPRTDFDHMPKTKAQWEALEHYDLAREAINPRVRQMFDRVVIEGRPLGKLAITFRTAARRLLEHIEGKVAL